MQRGGNESYRLRMREIIGDSNIDIREISVRSVASNIGVEQRDWSTVEIAFA